MIAAAKTSEDKFLLLIDGTLISDMIVLLGKHGFWGANKTEPYQENYQKSRNLKRPGDQKKALLESKAS
jgi:hypothetical protein